MSLKGRLLQAGIGLFGSPAQQRAMHKAGLLTGPAKTGAFGGAPMPYSDMEGVIAFHHDFFEIIVNSSNEAGWIYTEVGAGGSIIIGAANSEPGGHAIMTTDNTSADATQLQWHDPVFKLVPGKKLWYKTRVRWIGQASTFLCGLSKPDAGLISPSSVEDAIVYFSITNPPPTVAALVSWDNPVVGNTGSLGAVEQNNWYDLGFHWDGTKLIAWMNDSGRDEITNAAAIPTGASDLMAPFFTLIAGTNFAAQMAVDYVSIVQYR